MTVLDWIIIIVIVISSLISLKRGFVKEALSLASWIAALIISRMFAGNLAVLLADVIDSANWRLAAAFAILFVVTLIVGAMINHLISEFIRMTGLTGTDRVLGVVFGVLRGIILVVAMLALMKLFALDSLWEGAMFAEYFDPLIKWTGQSVTKVSDNIINLGK